MSAKIVFIINKRKLFGILTRIFTGCYCYHCGILINNYFYDVSLIRRRTKWTPESYPDAKVIVFDSPVEIDENILIEKILDKNTIYGLFNYLLYGIKPIARFFKIPIKNMGGIICSSQVNEDLIDSGWKSPWPIEKHPPSPCVLLSYFINRYKQLI